MVVATIIIYHLQQLRGRYGVGLIQGAGAGKVPHMETFRAGLPLITERLDIDVKQDLKIKNIICATVSLLHACIFATLRGWSNERNDGSLRIDKWLPCKAAISAHYN